MKPKLRFADFVDPWDSITLGKVGRIIRGASPRPQGDPRYYGGNVPRLMVKDVTRDGKYVTPRIDFLTEEGAKKSRPCKKGTLTIVCSGTVGIPSILAVDACIHDGFLAILDIDKSVSIDFLYQILSTLQEKFDQSATHGGVFTNLTTELLANFRITIPSIEEQIKVSAFLDSVDEKIRQLKRKKELLEQYKKGMMQQLFSQKLRFKDEGGKEFPEWEEKRLGEICQKIQDGTHFSPKTIEDGTFLYLTSKNVKNGHLDLITAEYVSDGDHASIYKRCDVQKGDILLTKDGTIGQVCVNELEKQFSLLSSVAFLRVKSEYNNYFVYHLLTSPTGEREISNSIAGQALKRITLSKIKAFKFLFPSLPEQQKIASFLSALDKKIELVSAQVEQAQQFKKGLLQQMFV